MDPKKLKQMRRFLYETSKNFGKHLRDVPPSEWPDGAHWMPDPIRPIRVLRSRDFLVQVYTEPNDIVRLSVCRTELNNDGKWKDGIAWETMQRLKEECGYAGRDAVELFPAAEDVVNVANFRHLWVLPEKLTFGWRKPDWKAREQ